MVFDELLELLDVLQLGLGFKHSLDVAKVFFATAFFVKNQLPQDNVFWGSDVDWPIVRGGFIWVGRREFGDA